MKQILLAAGLVLSGRLAEAQRGGWFGVGVGGGSIGLLLCELQ